MTAAAARPPGVVALSLVLALSARAARADEGGEDEVIDDPELAGAPLSSAAAPASAPAGTDEPVGATAARVSAEARLGVDTDWDRATGEDVVVHRLRLDAEVGQPLGRQARLFAAARLEHVARSRPGELPDDVGGSFEARLLDAWLDARVLGVDLRVGNQVVPWGRVDVLSPGNVWNPLDLRDPFGDAQALPVVPVPAVRLDARPWPWLAASLVWQPVFVPLRADLLGTDQALLGPGAPRGLAALAEPLARLYGDDAIVPLDDPTLATRPRQNLAASQVGARLTATFGEAEVGATAFWGLSKVPTVELSPALRDAIAAGPDDAIAWLAVLSEMAEGRTLLSLEYERNLQLVLDVEAPAGEVLVKGELGWAPRRALLRFDDADCAATCVVHAGVVQGAVQVERVEDDWQVLAEGLVFAAQGDSAAGATDLLFFGGARTVIGAVGVVRWAPPDGDWDLGGSVVLLSPGPSATALARVGRAFGAHLRVEVGAIVTAATDDSALVALDGADMVFVAARVAE